MILFRRAFLLLVFLPACSAPNATLNAGELEPALLEAQYATPQDQFVEVDGVRFRVRIQGPEEAPAIVLLHGFTSSLEAWDDIANSFASEYRVISYDLAGHGLTGPDDMERYSADNRAAFLNSLLGEIDVERATIVGNSLGGYIAWKFAANYPERVDRLVLISAAAYPFAGFNEAPQPVMPMFEAYLRHGTLEDIKRVYASQFASVESLRQDRVQIYFDMMRRAGNPEEFVRHTAQFTLSNPEEQLAQIQAPTLVLWGAQDPLIPVSDAKKIATTMPNAILELLEGVGHIPHEEAPSEVLEAISSFLNPEELGIDDG